MKSKLTRFGPLLALVVALGAGCASSGPRPAAQFPGYGQGSGQSAYVEYGRVSKIEQMTPQQDGSVGAGAVIGGTAGAVLGRQMGDSTRGKNVGTILGAVAGAVIGHQIEKEHAKNSAYFRVSVSMDRGGVRYFDYRETGSLRVGDRVRVENDQIVKP